MDKTKLSQKINNMAMSQTVKLDTLAKAMIAKGQKVINVTAGQPDFDTFSEIKQSVIKSLKAGNNKYSAPNGMLELKQAIVKEIKTDYQVNYVTDEIVVVNGAKQGLFNLFQVLLNKGDEVIIPIPGWVSYSEQVKFAGGKPVFVKHDKNFQLDIQAIKKKITGKTKAIVLNSPNNPTAQVYAKKDLLTLNKLIKNKNIFVISDDPYRYILFDNIKFTSFAQINKKQTIIVDSVSKSHAVPGWRVGWCAGPKDVIVGMSKLQSQCSGNVCNLAQIAAIRALGLSKNKIKPWIKEYTKRRDYLIEELAKIPGLSFHLPQGAFYFFIDIRKIEKDSIKFCEKLLKKEKVALVPGKAFGLDGYVRLSFAFSLEDLQEAIKRLKRFINNY